MSLVARKTSKGETVYYVRLPPEGDRRTKDKWIKVGPSKLQAQRVEENSHANSSHKIWLSLLLVLFSLLTSHLLVLADATLGPWEYTNSMQVARAGHGMAAGPNSLYVIGGQGEGPTPLFSVEYATVTPDGALSSWQFTSSLNVPRVLTTAAATATHVYVVGGASHPSLIGLTLASVESAPILPNGSLGAWSFTSALTVGRANAVALVHENFLYVIAGYGAGQLDTVERAEIFTDGSLGPWAVLSEKLTMLRERPGAAIVGQTMVVLGGLSANGGGIVNTTEFAPILSDGTLGVWQIGTPMATPRYHLSAVGAGHTVLALGGYNDGPPSAWATTEESMVSSLHLGAWAEGPPLQETRAYLAAAILKGQVYVAGGEAVPFNPPQGIRATVERSSITPVDRDKDGIPDEEEACFCLDTPTGQVVTAVGCSIDQACPCEAPLGRAAWNNHTEYIQCVKNVTTELVSDGVMAKKQRQEIIRQAQRSRCGR